MRVCHYNTHAFGGSYEYAALLCHALDAEGIASRLRCKVSPADRGVRRFFDRLIRRSYVSVSREPWHGTRRFSAPSSARDFEEIDVVHLHTVADWFDVPSWIDTLPRKIGVVISLHDMWHFTGGCFLYRGCNLYSETCTPCPILKSPFNWFLARDEHRRKLQAYRNCRAQFVANSFWLAELAARSPIVKASGGVRVIPPGIDTMVFKPQDRNRCRKQLDLPQNAFVIITGGASLTDANKNVPWLFKQLSHLPDLQDVIILAFGEGSAPVPDYLNVRFTGGIRDRRDLAQLFAAADVFVSASLMETYGLTLVESMACGTPVVAFRAGGIPEAAPDGQGAILCESGNGAALIEAITKLRDSPQLRKTLGEAGRETARVRNAESSFANAFAQLYQECVSSREDAQCKQIALKT